MDFLESFQGEQTTDGHPLFSGRISDATSPVGPELPGHQETILFHITRLATYPAVLGMTWLSRHDSVISWGQRSITFVSACCHLHCLGARVPYSVEILGPSRGKKDNCPHHTRLTEMCFVRRKRTDYTPPQALRLQNRLVAGGSATQQPAVLHVRGGVGSIK